MSVTLSEIVPARVLLIRLGAVRDGLMTVPLAVDTKRLWPNSRVSWIVDSEIEQLLRAHSHIDEVIRIERNWLRNPRGLRALRQRLCEPNFDLVLDPQSVFKSAMLGVMSKCPTRVGFDRPLAREFASFFLTHRVRPTARHRVDIYRQLLQPWRETQLGVGEFHLPHDSTARQRVETAIEHTVASRKWVAIYPGAIWPTAVWPLDRFAAIAKFLLINYQLPSVVLWRDQHEKLVAKVIVEQAQPAAFVAPELSIAELAETCRQASFLISGDSDVLQIASSVGTPCISLHGPTWADEFGVYRRNNYSIQSPFPLIGRRRVRKGSNIAMQAIEIEEVQYYIERLIRDLAVLPAMAAA
jgi:heptosyltransferase I